MNLRIMPPVLEEYAKTFRREYSAVMMKKQWPPNYELNTSHFEKNEDYDALYSFIRGKLPGNTFHPKKLYEYIFKYLRKANNGGAGPQEISWKVTKTFPEILFRLIGFDDFTDFLKSHQEELGERVFAGQMEKIAEFEDRRGKPKSLIAVFHCYISNVEFKSYKLGTLGVYDDGTVEHSLKEEKKTSYCGKITSTDIHTMITLYKQVKAGRKTKKAPVSELNIRILNGKGFEKQVFLFGNYCAVNNNDFHDTDPNLASGPIILERIPIASIKGNALNKIPFQDPASIEPILATMVVGNRYQLKKQFSEVSHKPDFAARRVEELQFIKDHHPTIVSPERCSGDYICLIYSKTHGALRKLTLTIKNDLTIIAKARRFVDDSSDLLEYKGFVGLFKDGLLKFQIRKKRTDLDYIEGIFRFDNRNKPIYGFTSGIFKGLPKTGMAILVKKRGGIDQMTSFDNPGLLRLTSEEFSELDKRLKISDFFSGQLKEQYLNSDLIMNHSKALFNRLLGKKLGNFENLSGLYAEYYFDQREKIIRMDHLQINEDGTIYMIGDYKYEGEIDYQKTILNFHLKPISASAFPVSYTLHNERNANDLLCGLLRAITPDNKAVESSLVVLHRLSPVCESKEDFFQKTFRRIPLDSPQLQDLNVRLNGLGDLLQRNSFTTLMVGKLENMKSNENYHESVSPDSCFYAACFHAGKQDTNSKILAYEQLMAAKRLGFRDQEKLMEAIQPDGPLVEFKEFIRKHFDLGEDLLAGVLN